MPVGAPAGARPGPCSRPARRPAAGGLPVSAGTDPTFTDRTATATGAVDRTTNRALRWRSLSPAAGAPSRWRPRRAPRRRSGRACGARPREAPELPVPRLLLAAAAFRPSGVDLAEPPGRSPSCGRTGRCGTSGCRRTGRWRAPSRSRPGPARTGRGRAPRRPGTTGGSRRVGGRHLTNTRREGPVRGPASRRPSPVARPACRGRMGR